jgi:hypothetical protein
MEPPESWNLLTSSLAVSNLDELDSTWAFLVIQGLVTDGELQRNSVAAIVHEVRAEGEITGPSEARRIADGVISRKISTVRALHPDPWGKAAKARREVILDWLRES